MPVIWATGYCLAASNQQMGRATTVELELIINSSRHLKDCFIDDVLWTQYFCFAADNGKC